MSHRPHSHAARTRWHADDAQLAAYAGARGQDRAPRRPLDRGPAGRAPGTAGAVLAASLEAHLLECGQCRDRLAALTSAAGTDDRDAAWQRLTERIDEPSRRAFGARLPAVVATPAMLGAALLAAVLLAGVPLAAALLGGAGAWAAAIAVAPVAPMAAVALAYREEADPAGAIAAAAPVAGLRLVALRACVVAAVALPLAIGVQVLLDVTARSASLGRGLAWCLPGLALAGVVLAAGTTRLDPARVAAALGVGWAGWVAVRGTSDRLLRPELLLDTLAQPAVQLTALAVAALTLTFAVARRDDVAYRRLA